MDRIGGVIGYMVYRSSSRYKVLVIGRYRYVTIRCPLVVDS